MIIFLLLKIDCIWLTTNSILSNITTTNILAHRDRKGGEKFLAWQRAKISPFNTWGLGKNPVLQKDDNGYFLFMETKERKTSIYLVCDAKNTGQPKFRGDETKTGTEEYTFYFTHATACPKAPEEPKGDACTMVQNRKKINSHPIIHCPTSSGVSEMSGASERAK